MSRWIDADALYETLCHLWDKSDSEDFEKGVFRIVINAPSIDIVRCGECKYSSDDGTYGCMADHFNGLDDVYHRMYADDFCSYGEREGE